MEVNAGQHLMCLVGFVPRRTISFILHLQAHGWRACANFSDTIFMHTNENIEAGPLGYYEYGAPVCYSKRRNIKQQNQNNQLGRNHA